MARFACFAVLALLTLLSPSLQASVCAELARDSDLNRMIYQDNLFLSRTVKNGISSKKFTESADVIAARARTNAVEAYNTISEMAADAHLTPEKFRQYLDQLNWMFTKGINAAIPGGAKGKAGEYRSEGYLDKDNGLNGEPLQALLKQNLEKLGEWLLAELQKPGADAVALGNEAHYQFSNDLRPYFDGKGRTARALIDFVFLRLGKPLPLFAEADLARAFDDYMNAVPTREGFAEYLARAAARSRGLK